LLAGHGAAIGTSAESGSRARLDYSQIFFGPLPGVNDEVRALKATVAASYLSHQRASTKPRCKLSSRRASYTSPRMDSPAERSARRQADDRSNKDPTRLGKWVARVENPLLRSGLALAGANQARSGNEDGILTAFEATARSVGHKTRCAFSLRHRVGEVKNGEGVYGLRRAFVYGGG